MGIKLDYASIYHPQTNGQVERANGLIMSGIKPRLVRSLKESEVHWVDELDSVLWGLQTTPNRTTGYTPFFMVYSAEAVLPCDIIHDSSYVTNVSIIFYCSMLLYYLFWMLLGFILHFYIIFGTNLLTQGPVQIAVFFLFQYFAEKEYQTESKRNETFGSVIVGTNVIQRTWSAS